MPNFDVLESVDFAPGKLNEDKGVVEGVKIIGNKSANGVDYPDKALAEATELYEGAKVNIDHPPRNKPHAERSYADRFGSLRNVRLVEGKGLFGDLHFNLAHRLAPQFIYDVKNSPGNVGLSHNATARLFPMKNKRRVCESILSVKSVDVVADPATVSSLFESKEGERKPMKVRKKKSNGDNQQSSFSADEIKATLEGKGFEDEDIKAVLEEMEEGAGGGEAAPTSTSDVDAVLTLIKRDLENPNLDLKATIKAVAAKIKALKELIPGGTAEAKPAEGSDGEGDMQSIDDDEEGTDDNESDTVTLESVLEVCDAASFKPDAKQRKMLATLDTKKEVLETVQQWQKESDLEDNKPNIHNVKESTYKDSKEWAKGLKS